ncbi:SMP-30/gluconolactonase/LRE family protein [Cryptosporangium minutisporangium]|uniref:SMP-30/gluconolactonase/LRE family protein n=1 Tax=Cryptosporangium minutisporangium TaxID=113569 RepID=A0ABP6SWA0_9ACTN
MARPPLKPVVWTPPPKPGWGDLPPGAPDLPLRVITVPGTGPEDVVVDEQGRVLTGLEDGRILAITPGAEQGAERIEVIAETGGRPLGVELFGDGTLVVCDAQRGLLRVDPATGLVETLATEAAGVPLRVCNNAAIGVGGTIWFTDSSQRFALDHWEADILEHSGTGRLLRRDPGGVVEVVRDGLFFANGVTVSADGSFLVYAETGAYALTRLWLTGDRAGTFESFGESLPGFPDNVSTGSDGLIWVALAAPRKALLDRVSPLPGIARRLTWALPDKLRPGPVPTTWVVALDDAGRIVHDLHDPGRRYPFVTGVREHRGTVYLGSLTAEAIAICSAP